MIIKYLLPPAEGIRRDTALYFLKSFFQHEILELNKLTPGVVQAAFSVFSWFSAVCLAY
jgi:hypothetical protein